MYEGRYRLICGAALRAGPVFVLRQAGPEAARITGKDVAGQATCGGAAAGIILLRGGRGDGSAGEARRGLTGCVIQAILETEISSST